MACGCRASAMPSTQKGKVRATQAMTGTSCRGTGSVRDLQEFCRILLACRMGRIYQLARRAIQLMKVGVPLSSPSHGASATRYYRPLCRRPLPARMRGGLSPRAAKPARILTIRLGGAQRAELTLARPSAMLSILRWVPRETTPTS
jgi:hypothetical protein